MDSKQIKTFLKVAERLNFTRAAEDLQYSQPAITAQISQLEQELQGKLFERVGKNICLSEKGVEFLEYARKIMFYIEQASINTRESNNMSGHIRIGCLESIAEAVLPQVIQKFCVSCPGASISIITDKLPILMNMLNENEIDILFIFAEPINSDKWIRCNYLEQSVSFVSAPMHELAKESKVSLQQISSALIISEGRSRYSYASILREIFQSQSIPYRPVVAVESVPIIITMLLNNMGVSLLPDYVVKRYLEQGLLTKIHVSSLNKKMALQVFYHKEKKHTPTMDKLLFEIEKALAPQ